MHRPVYSPRFILSTLVLLHLVVGAVLTPVGGLAAVQRPAGVPTDQTAPLTTVVSRWTCTPPGVDGSAPHHEWGTAPSVAFPGGNGRVYFLNDATYLYLLVDVPGDTVDDPPLPSPPWGDYPWVSFDVDGDGNITPHVDLHYALFPGTHNLGVQYYLGPSSWTTLTVTPAQFDVGFAPSFASPAVHRIWEFGIPLSEIGAAPGGIVRTGFRAYSQTPSFTDDLPPNFTNDFTSLVEVRLAQEACGVRLVKNVYPHLAYMGNILNYQINYSLPAGITFTNVIIQDALPSVVTYLPGSANPPATFSGGVLTWNLGNLPGGTSGSVKFQVMVQHGICRERDFVPVVDYASLSADLPFIHEYTANGARAEISCTPFDFPTNDPPYAESEITVDPYPLVVGQVTQLCTTIVNSSAQTQTVSVEFDLANFGIGLPFSPIPAAGNPQQVVIPPGQSATVCIFWTPTTPGHQCVQVVVTDATGQFTLYSQRNLDVAEQLVPGQPTTFTVPVGNPSPDPMDIIIVVRNNCPGWVVNVNPMQFSLNPGQQTNITVTVTPPAGGTLGTGCTVDIEAWVVDAEGNPIGLLGGVEKIDEPPIPLGEPGEPPFAEKEITVRPYPLFSGVPAEACVLLENNTDLPYTVTVEFMLANLGIGLPFNTIPAVGGNNPQTVVIPPHTTVEVCITFVPTGEGHRCLAVKLTLPGTPYEAWSYRNLDVAERLEPGMLANTLIPVANPTGAPANIDLMVDNTCPGWTATVSPTLLLNVGPNSTDIRYVTLTVTPPAGPLGSGCHVDLLAYINGVLIGGVRKIDRPPFAPPIDEVPWAETEITVNPDPVIVGQPAQLCVTLLNPTGVTQTVDVTFAYADFGAGINFTNIQTVPNVAIPPNGSTTVCITWTPAPGGTLHRCVRVQLHRDGYQDVYTQRNLDLIYALPVEPVDLPPFLIHNPRPVSGTIVLAVRDKLELTPRLRPTAVPFAISIVDGETGLPVNPGAPLEFAGNESREFFLRLEPVAGRQGTRMAAPDSLGAMEGGALVIDVLPYLDGQQLTVDGLPSAVRFVIVPQVRVYLPLVVRGW